MKLFEKEINQYKYNFDCYLKDISDQVKKSDFSFKCNLYTASIISANKRYITSIIFSIVIILFIVSLYSFIKAMAAMVILFAIPYFISRVESDRKLLTEFPFRGIEAKINFRNLYATSVIVVGIGTIFASSILTW